MSHKTHTDTKLTPTQEKALKHIATNFSQTTTAYDLKVNKCGNLATLHRLSSLGYVRGEGQGHSAFPQNGTWRVTRKGVNKALELLDQVAMQGDANS